MQLLDDPLLLWLPRLVQEPYWHPDQILSRPAPDGLKHEHWLPILRYLRAVTRRTLPFFDVGGSPFVFSMTDQMVEVLHRTDRTEFFKDDKLPHAPDLIHMARAQAMMEESWASVSLSGESLPRQDTIEMLRSGRHPNHRAEEKVMKLHQVVKRLPELTKQKITPDSLAALNDELVGGSSVRVADTDNPRIPARLLAPRLAALCEFAGSETLGEPFLHPLIRAVLAAAWLLHDAPFVNGNGRTSRLLLYWAAVRAGHTSFQMISVSSIMAEHQIAPAELLRRALTDDRDLTYFLVPTMGAIQLAMKRMHEQLLQRQSQISEGRNSWNTTGLLNIRQEAVVLSAMKNPGTLFTIDAHRQDHDLAYATARADLLHLEQIGLMLKRKRGKGFVFETAPDWQAKLKMLNGSD